MSKCASDSNQQFCTDSSVSISEFRKLMWRFGIFSLLRLKNISKRSCAPCIWQQRNLSFVHHVMYNIKYTLYIVTYNIYIYTYCMSLWYVICVMSYVYNLQKKQRIKLDPKVDWAVSDKSWKSKQTIQISGCRGTLFGCTGPYEMVPQHSSWKIGNFTEWCHGL